MPYTTNGIWYPTDADSTRIWELMQQQAETVDAAIAERDERLDTGTPSWLYRRSTDQTAIAGGVNTIVSGMSLVTVDSSPAPGDYFTYSAGTFTVTRAGRYRLRGVATWAMGTIPIVLLTLKVDGIDVDVHSSQMNANYTVKTRVEAEPMYMEVGDTFRAEVGHAGGGSGVTASLVGSSTEHRIGMSIGFLGD